MSCKDGDATILHWELAIPRVGWHCESETNTYITASVAFVLGLVVEILGIARFKVATNFLNNGGSVWELALWKLGLSFLHIVKILLVVTGNWFVLLAALIGKVIGDVIGWSSAKPKEEKKLIDRIERLEKRLKSVSDLTPSPGRIKFI